MVSNVGRKALHKAFCFLYKLCQRRVLVSVANHRMKT